MIFTGNVNFAGEPVDQFLAKYMNLVREDGSDVGEAVEVDYLWDQAKPNEFILKPKQTLAPQQSYRVSLKAKPLSQRSQGLVDYSYSFKTASGITSYFDIDTVTPHSINTQGEEVVISLLGTAVDPDFYVAGKAAQITETIVAGQSYRVLIPSNQAGPAKLTVLAQDGSKAEQLAAINYVGNLSLSSIVPATGSVAGGDEVQLIGQGFEPGLERLTISFGGTEVPLNDIKVIDAEHILVKTPAGALGQADVQITYDDGRFATLSEGFEYRMPGSFELEGRGRIYDTLLDPSQNYLFVAAGHDGIYLQDLSKAQANQTSLVGHYELPEGYAALGLAGFFEQSNDRIFVTGAKINRSGEPEAGSGQLFILAIDSLDISQYTLVNQLALTSQFAKGLFVQNQSAFLAMAELGLGQIDTYQHSKLYLSSNVEVSDKHLALDVAPIEISLSKLTLS